MELGGHCFKKKPFTLNLKAIYNENNDSEQVK